MTDTYDVIVLGGGHNGLTAAAYAAKAGRRVLLLEARDEVGGLAGGRSFHAGYTAPGILHDTRGVRPWVLKDLQLAKHGLKVRSDDVPVFLSDAKQGRGILLWRDAAKAQEEIAPYADADARAYGQYRETLDKLAPFVRKVFDDFPPELTQTSMGGYLDLMKKAVSLRLMGKDDMMEVLRIAPMCVADWLGEFFKTDLLKAGLAGPAVYSTWCGPWSPGTNANLLMAECLSYQSVEGGGPALIGALQRAASAFGVTVKTGAKVERLVLEGERVTGVTLADGSTFKARQVASSMDPRSLFEKLIPARALSLRFEQDVLNYRMRGTTGKLHLALKDYPTWRCRPGVKPEYIRIGAGLDALEKAFDAVKYRQMAEHPALDIYVPSLEDKSFAPEGGHVMSVLVNFVAHELEGMSSDEARQLMFKRTMAVLEEHAPGIGGLVDGQESLLPADLSADYHLVGGQLHHGEHAADQLLIRPMLGCAHYKTPFEGLYLCGSGSHPGGGITCAPGALAAKAVLLR